MNKIFIFIIKLRLTLMLNGKNARLDQIWNPYDIT